MLSEKAIFVWVERKKSGVGGEGGGGRRRKEIRDITYVNDMKTANQKDDSVPHHRICLWIMMQIMRKKQNFFVMNDPADITNGTKMFLMFYIVLSIALLVLGIPAAFVWMVLPFIITLLSVYALCTEKHRYLYPFLILSEGQSKKGIAEDGIHVAVFILLALMVIAFTAANYPTLKHIIGI
ncbi:unnamed protein product [Enterobius vermicularis]|uniref:PRA1 family protein n=1 Tax=Enterobius vermicularis TaxID=51028 RepID=A0A0N4VNU1_ENTVE|nr:unnamed protein product [Enterobius vermicularis]